MHVCTLGGGWGEGVLSEDGNTASCGHNSMHLPDFVLMGNKYQCIIHAKQNARYFVKSHLPIKFVLNLIKN